MCVVMIAEHYELKKKKLHKKMTKIFVDLLIFSSWAMLGSSDLFIYLFVCFVLFEQVGTRMEASGGLTFQWK